MNNPSQGIPGDLAVFVAVADTAGFSSAARRLGVSKAMVSVAVRRLEARLGVRLLQRTTRRLSLTEAGAATLPHAQRSVAAAREAEEAATQSLAAPRGLLRINAPMSFGILHLGPALGAFARACPEVHVDVVLDDRVVDLVEGAFDLALRIGTLADSALVAQRIARSRNVLVAHPRYLAHTPALEAPEDLGAHATVVYALASAGPRWTLSAGSDKTTVRVKPRLVANSSLVLRDALLDGVGIGRLPEFIVGEDLAKGRLVRVLPRWELPPQALHAVTTGRDYVPRKTTAFIDFLRARIGAPPYWERGLVAPA